MTAARESQTLFRFNHTKIRPCAKSRGRNELSQPSSKQAAALLVGHELGVAYQTRGTAPSLKHEFPTVKRFEFGAVADADQCDIGLRHQPFHKLVLTLRIERRRRLVKHDDVGAKKNYPRKCQALLLTS
jgi:hypothetical protein